ncbi:YwqJ-related putative deaminase [Streptomyces resistomycificus]|uniref:YwqJ-related putative deaminase n=1 Tax=Streptomyces resistomycificus TaxID=67356 RepID=UPI0004AB1C62|nr:YwqJ-related putative deaminase [Streptomyces resistomycificus]
MTIMNATQTGPHPGPRPVPPGGQRTAPHTHTGPHTGPHHAGPRTGPSGDPRIGWSSTEAPHAPTLRHRRDGILPTVAAALSVRGATLTGTAARGDQPPALHPLVQDFLDTLPSDRRDRFTGRCAETMLISRHIATLDAARSKRAARRPMTNGEARKALKQAKLTARRIREDGDPLHGSFAPPCRACTALSAHFGVRVVDPTTTDD